MNLKFWQNADSFRLMTKGKDYSVKIIDAVLSMNCIKVDPDVILGHNEGLKIKPALYPYVQSDMKRFEIAAGQFSYSVEDVYRGKVPSKLFIGFVSAEGYSGSFVRNPFDFAHYNLSQLSFFVDGKCTPKCPFSPNYDNDDFAECYLSMFTTTGLYGQMMGNDISMDEYKHGYAIYGIDVDNQQQRNILAQKKTGHTRLEVKFAKPLPESVIMVVYAKFHNTLQIDIARNIIV